jgi:lactoylglutathione lyase
MSEGIVVNHVGQCVTDLARSRRFYEHVLGFEFWREVVPPQAASAQLLGLDAPLDSRICYLRRDGFVLELFEYGAPGHRHPPARRAMDEPGLTHLSVSCDVAAVRARVGDYGGEVLHDTDVGSAIFIRDPDGQLIELLPLSYADHVATL